MSNCYVQLQPFYLYGSGGVVGDTTLKLQSFKTIDGVNLTMANFGTKGYITIQPNESTSEEQVSFTGLTQNSDGTAVISGVSSVSFLTPYTETSGLLKDHPGGVKVVVSLSSGLVANFANKGNTEIVIGKWTFTTAQRPTLTADADTLVDEDLVTYGQLARTAIAGAGDADLTHKGIVEIATTVEIDAGTATGGTGASVVVRPDQLAASIYATRLPSVDQKAGLAGSYGTPSASNKYVTEGDQSRNIGLLNYATTVGGTADAITLAFTPTLTSLVEGMKLRFKATGDNTTAVTVNCDSLGVKDVKLSPATALSGGEIKNGAEIELTYDGTNFQMSVVPPALIAGATSNSSSLHGHGPVAISRYTTASGPSNTVVTLTVPAGRMGTNNGIRIKAYVTGTTGYSGGGVPNIAMGVTFGGSSVFSGTICTGNDTGSGIYELVIFNNASASAQYYSDQLILTKGTSSSQESYVGAGTATVNTALAQDVVITLTNTAGGGSATGKVYNAYVELMLA